MFNKNEEKKNEVAIVDNSIALAIAEEFGVTGAEHLDPTDIKPPFLRLAQKINPELDPGNAKYIEGLKAGEFYSPSTSQVLGNQVKAILATSIKNYVEWKPREDGGGVAGVHAIDSGMQLQATQTGSKLFMPNGNELKETNNLFLYLHVDGAWSPYILPASSTMLTPARNLLTALSTRAVTGTDGLPVKLPYFSATLSLGAVPQSNKFGTFYNIKVDVTGEPVPVELMRLIAQEVKKINAAHYQKKVNLTETHYKAEDTSVIDAVAESMV